MQAFLFYAGCCLLCSAPAYAIVTVATRGAW
jgi:hypothetical protein